MSSFLKFLFFLFLVSTGLIFVAVVFYVLRLANEGKLNDFKDKVKLDVSNLQENLNAEEIVQSVQSVIKPFLEKKSVQKPSKVKVEDDIPFEKRKPIDNATQRQEAILDFLKSRSEATISEITLEFDEVSSRTLRRDMDKLEQKGLVKQYGKTKDSRYKFLA